MKKIVICEFNHFHTEVFPVYEYYFSRIFSEPNLEFTYYAIPSKVNELDKIYDSVKPVYNSFIYYICAKTGLRGLYFKFIIKKIIAHENPDWIIVNSIDQERTLSAFLAIDSPRKLGIIHNPESFQKKNNSGYYFVLSKALFKKYKFCDGYFLPFIAKHNIHKNRRNDITISILGNVQFKRRNYPYLIEVAAELKKLKIHNVKFNIVGSSTHKDYPKLHKLISKYELENYFVLHKNLNDEEFMKEVVNSSFIMPLLYEEKRYLENKITASLSHASANSVPLILSKTTASHWKFTDEEALVYLDTNDLAQRLKLIDEQKIDNLKEKFMLRTENSIHENISFLKTINF